ncbi:MAG: signal peptidase I [Lachnospiraceae bacterium]|nr:signal peptidase I [Lachnospiraceae bacterium]
MLVCEWKIYSKAGEPGWAVIVPFYNLYVLFKIAMGNGWLFLLMLVPFVNFVVAIIMIFKLSSAFGHGVGFGFGLLFLPVIFIPILAFGSSEYVGA